MIEENFISKVLQCVKLEKKNKKLSTNITAGQQE